VKFPKSVLLECADKTLDDLIVNHEINKLTKTSKQVKEYHNVVKEKFSEVPIDVSLTLLYRFLTKSFENMKDRSNLVISTYIKLYCKTFVSNLQLAMGEVDGD